MVYPDGWAGDLLCIKINTAMQQLDACNLQLTCRRAWPVATDSLSLSVRVGDEVGFIQTVTGNGSFELKVPLSRYRNNRLLTITVEASAVFMPCQYEAGSTDSRRLAFLVEGVVINQRLTGMKGLFCEAFKSFKR
jgi:hypothetical protein